MSAITYTALREFEPTQTVVRSDISVDALDDSFNAPAGLAGFLDDEWILVSGFANAANNGWFQINGNSTATKILQDTSSALVTEAAGPSVTIKGYKRGLNQIYSLEFGVERADRAVSVVRNVRQPLGGGAPEVLTHRREPVIDVRTTVIPEAKLPQWREFLASVEGGETFTFDRYGTIAVPVEQKTVMLENESYAEEREGTMFNYRIAFRVLVLA